MDGEAPEPAKRGRGRPKGSRNRATIEREAKMEAEIAGMLTPEEEVPEEVPEIPEIPEVPEAPAPAPAPARHVLDVSFESDAILGAETPQKPRKARKAPEAPPAAEVPPPPRKPRAPVRQKRARPPSPSRGASPPRPGSVGAPVDLHGLIKRELASRRRASRDEKSREYDSYFAW